MAQWGRRKRLRPKLGKTLAPGFSCTFMLRLAARRFSTATQKPIAVVLAGCGVYDGSEIQEAVSVLVNLSKAGREVREGVRGSVSSHACWIP